MALNEIPNVDEQLFKDSVEDAITKLDKEIERCVRLFCHKQELHYEKDMWVAGDIGSIICISDMNIKFTDIRIDLEKNVRKGIFSEWYWTVTESDLPYINYNSWIMGLRHLDLDLKQDENGNTSAI